MHGHDGQPHAVWRSVRGIVTLDTDDEQENTDDDVGLLRTRSFHIDNSCEESSESIPFPESCLDIGDGHEDGALSLPEVRNCSIQAPVRHGSKSRSPRVRMLPSSRLRFRLYTCAWSRALRIVGRQHAVLPPGTGVAAGMRGLLACGTGDSRQNEPCRVSQAGRHALGVGTPRPRNTRLGVGTKSAARVTPKD